MQIVTAAERRTTTTPNATMTTLASPTLGAAASSLWLVEMGPGAEGPVHCFVDEIVWSLTRGSGELVAEGRTETLGTADTVVLPAGMMRQFRAGSDGFTAVVTTRGTGEVLRADGASAGVPPWVG